MNSKLAGTTMRKVIWKEPVCTPALKRAGVRCNCVRHAILSAPDTFAYAFVSMQKPSGGHVHDYVYISVHALNLRTICSMNIHVFYDLQRIPNGQTFSMSFMTWQKMANVFRRPSAFNSLQGRFCTGADTTAYANVSWWTHLHYAAGIRADTVAYAKPSGGHYCICNTVLRIVLHRGHNCMRHGCANVVVSTFGTLYSARLQDCT